MAPPPGSVPDTHWTAVGDVFAGDKATFCAVLLHWAICGWICIVLSPRNLPALSPVLGKPRLSFISFIVAPETFGACGNILESVYVWMRCLPAHLNILRDQRWKGSRHSQSKEACCNFIIASIFLSSFSFSPSPSLSLSISPSPVLSFPSLPRITSNQLGPSWGGRERERACNLPIKRKAYCRNWCHLTW